MNCIIYDLHLALPPTVGLYVQQKLRRNSKLESTNELLGGGQELLARMLQHQTPVWLQCLGWGCAPVVDSRPSQNKGVYQRVWAFVPSWLDVIRGMVGGGEASWWFLASAVVRISHGSVVSCAMFLHGAGHMANASMNNNNNKNK